MDTEILCIIEKLNIPQPDFLKVKNVEKESNILESRFIGTIYEEILKKKILSLNFGKNYEIDEDSIYRYTEFDNGKKYEITFENIRKEIIQKYNRNIYKEKIDNQIVSNTANYIERLINHTDFKSFLAKEIILLNAKLNYKRFSKNNLGSIRIGTLFKPDVLIDDLIIDIKAYEEIKFTHNMFIQLFLYYVGFNYIFNRTNSKISNGAKITKYKGKFSHERLGIYFAKHNYLWVFNISELCSQKELDILIKFSIDNIKSNNLNFPKQLESLFNFFRK